MGTIIGVNWEGYEHGGVFVCRVSCNRDMAFAIIDDSAMSEKTWSGKGYDWQAEGAVMYSRATVHVSKRLLLTAQIDKGPSTRKSGRFCAVPVADHRPGLCGLYGGSSRALSARLN